MLTWTFILPWHSLVIESHVSVWSIHIVRYSYKYTTHYSTLNHNIIQQSSYLQDHNCRDYVLTVRLSVIYTSLWTVNHQKPFPNHIQVIPSRLFMRNSFSQECSNNMSNLPLQRTSCRFIPTRQLHVGVCQV